MQRELISNGGGSGIATVCPVLSLPDRAPPSVTPYGKGGKGKMAIEINYLEKDVEDLLAAHTGRYLGAEMVKRQFRTPVGIVDLILSVDVSSRIYLVTEIKKGMLDACAFAQVWRYTKWLNSEFSREGKRIFVPFLIGDSLHTDLHPIVEYYEEGLFWEFRPGLLGRTFYRLFNFDPFTGVGFGFHNKAQAAYRNNLTYDYCHGDKFHYVLDELQSEKWALERDLQEAQLKIAELSMPPVQEVEKAA